MRRILFRLSLALLLLLPLIATIEESLSRASTAYKARNYYEAIPILEEITSKNPYHLESALLLVDCYMALENYARAELILERLRGFHPKALSLIQRSVQIALIENKDSEVEKNIETIKKLDNKNYFIYYAEGALLEKKGYYERAISKYERSISYKNDFIDSHIALAYLFFHQGDTEKAERLLRKAVALNPVNERVYYHLGDFFYRSGRYNESLAEIKKALHYYPKYSNAILLQASVYIKTREYDKAISVIETLDEEQIEGGKHYLLGILNERSGNSEKAIFYFEKFLSKNPDEMFARLAYERVLFEKTPASDVKRRLASEYYKTYGSKYESENDFMRAEVYYKRGLRLYPTDTDIRKALARMYLARGYFEKYYEQLKIISELSPDDEKIKSKIEYEGRTLSSLPSRKYKIKQYEIEHSATSIAVFDNFTVARGIHVDVEKALSQMLAHALHQFPKIKVVELYDRKYSEREQMEIPVSRDIDFSLSATISEYADSMHASVNLIESRSRRIVKTYTAHTSGKEQIPEMAIRIARDINNDIALFGRVVDIKGTSIVIDQGRLTGVTNNMLFNVYKGIYRPFSLDIGEINSQSESLVGVMKIEESDETLSIGEMVNPRHFDFVRLGAYISPVSTNTNMEAK